MKVCDPAVGSGAFPLGMMQVILSVWQAIGQREGESIKRGSLAMSRLKRKIIANNLYGVDIKPEAIEIAKLRMWLSMVVDIPTIDDVEPLPNLDYKLMAGNSLISTINGEHLIPDPTKDTQLSIAVNTVSQEIQPLLDLQHQYFESHSDERKGLSKQIREAEATVFRAAIVDRRQYWQGEQRKLEQDIRRVNKASAIQVKKQQAIEGKLKELDGVEINVGRGLRSLNFFQWHLHFNDVFQQKGGFDVVIGNPPYVRYQQLSELKTDLQRDYQCYDGAADLFVYFYERGFELLRAGGNLSYISSNKYMRSGYGKKLREFLGQQSTIQLLIDFGDTPVFEATAYPSIILLKKQFSSGHSTQALTWKTENDVKDISAVFQSSSFPILQNQFLPIGWKLEPETTLYLLDKLRSNGKSLKNYTGKRLCYGILTGLNNVFIVDVETRNRLVAEHSSSKEILKPLIRGRNVKRWRAEFADQHLIKIESSENKQHPWSGKSIEDAEKIFASTYPAIHSWFEMFRSQLTQRGEQGKYFWELRSCRYWEEFEQTKIIYPDITENSKFTLDTSGLLPDCTVFTIPNKSLYLLGVLNSEPVNFFFSQVCPQVRGGFMRFKSIFVEQISIPNASSKDREAISALVQKCLDAKGQNVAEWEAEINDRVAHLYGLTLEEIKIIEGGQN